MFDVDPFSRPVAIVEILLLLALATLVGWALGRLLLFGRVNVLRATLADKEAELEEERRAKFVRPAQKTQPAPAAASQPEPVAEAPAPFVHADPLEPALTFDQTPELIAADEPAPDEPLPDPSYVGSVGDSMVSAVGNSEAAVLTRIAARAGELNFDRIGRATATEADDLKDIIGVGPFLERKLHSLGIYTYRQIANFTKEDIDKVNEIIEFFPGRIERDNWVGQSRTFHERKYGKNEDA